MIEWCWGEVCVVVCRHERHEKAQKFEGSKLRCFLWLDERAGVWVGDVLEEVKMKNKMTIKSKNNEALSYSYS